MKRNVKKIGVIGHFGFGEELANGQTIKTKIITRALKERFTESEVLVKDTHGGIKMLLSLPFQALRLMRGAENIVILPAQRGVRILTPLLTFLNRFFHRKLHYCVVGGWLPELLKGRRALADRLKSFSGLYVETETMKSALEAMGFSNIFVVPNCKYLDPIGTEGLDQTYEEPYRLCTFSRVMREKGIEDAVQAVRIVNETRGKTMFTLDIFGPVDASQTDWFDKLKESFPDYVRYLGVVPFDMSVDTLKGYFALLFPTRFYTEGVPGTIIDAYAAGVPVIASRWESFGDIIDDEVTGLGYAFNDADALAKILYGICEDPAGLMSMKAACIDRAARYLPENALQPLFQQIGA